MGSKAAIDNTFVPSNLAHLAYLDNELCQSAGVIPLTADESKIVLGAMNPEYFKVKDIVNYLSKNYSVKTVVKLISSNEWERWFEDNGDNESYKLINKSRSNAFNHNECSFESEQDLMGVTSIEVNNHETNPNSNLLDTKISYLETNDLIELGSRDDEDEAILNLVNAETEDNTNIDHDMLVGVDLINSKDTIIAGVASILQKCIALKASDIHVEPLEKRFRIRYRLDGILKEIVSLPKSQIAPVISRLKIMSNLDIAEKRIPQDGRIRCILKGNQRDFRVSTLPGRWGEKVVLRSLENDSSSLNLSKLIGSNNELTLINQMASSPYGIVIVVGPTGSGKSTTLYSILNQLNTPGINISTVEDPVEYTLDGIHQVQVLREKGLDFAKALRSLMRQDPDIILVGETRDKETAQTAMEAALTGHLVFTTLHANDTSTAITRLSEMGIPPYLVGASVIGVVAQRLVRKVCKRCSTLRKLEHGKDNLAISHGIKQARVPTVTVGSSKLTTNKNSCEDCEGTGYKGRTGIFEVMRINEQLRELIMKEATADVLRENAFNISGRSLLSYGMELVKREETTIEEVQRVCLLEEST